MIIGMTGTLGAGKGTVVEYLVKERGFKHFSVSGFLREILIKRGEKINRNSLVNLGNQLRARFGVAYLAEELYKKASAEVKDGVIESLRNPAEVEALRSKGNFWLLAVDADMKIRYERIQARGGEKDGVSFEEFCRMEKREMNSKDPNKQSLRKCMAMADYTLFNNGTKEELYSKLKQVLKALGL